MADFWNNIFNYLIYLVSTLGYWGVIIIVGMEYACFPIPSEIILPFVGFMASKGRLDFFNALIFSIFGGILGSLACYYIGYFGGTPLIKTIQKKFPRSRSGILAADKWFEKYGRLSVFVARVFPLARTYISIPAGIARMKLINFVSYSFIGIVIWNFILIYLGFVLGKNWKLVAALIEKYNIFIILIITIGVCIYLCLERIKIKKCKPKCSKKWNG